MSVKQGKKTTYRGRFAPSPTGSLHLGSLCAALASYLDAKSNGGRWLVRIEDIDPPREDPDAKRHIPQQLEDHGLAWDEDIVYQSNRSELYAKTLESLTAKSATYPCSCSRQALKKMGGVCDRNCVTNLIDSTQKIATKFKLTGHAKWLDLIYGNLSFSPEELGGDFVLRRKEGLFSYQLAVAVDDHYQGITRVVRGADLLDSTARQLHIMKVLGFSAPEYAHLPLILAKNGQKLSKQNHAPALDSKTAATNIHHCLDVLGQNPPPELMKDSVQTVLGWARAHWNLAGVPKHRHKHKRRFGERENTP